MSWTNEELSHAAARDEQLCRSNGMTDKATSSYLGLRPSVPCMAHGRLPTDGGDGPRPNARRA
jgi:hypothetical protein